ncbi:MAG: SIS domain-containing protein [Desulfovibrionaceae bacterium]|nr:SIS domain-containing protein [Desulfovibrionaceae bacterium]MBF0514104.1 SIS domain-containing protein [Desulfovibrionaceae bacterium]
MQETIAAFYRNLAALMQAVEVTGGQGQSLGLAPGMQAAIEAVRARTGAGNKLMFIGNGASAAIASHMSTDFWKNGRMRAVAFNDSSVLTCIGNDYGFERLFAEPIGMFAMPGDVLMAISSSGRSANILAGVARAREKKCLVVTFSGFAPDNPLRRAGDFNFYVPADSYGPVEVLHHALCHGMLDTMIACLGPGGA